LSKWKKVGGLRLSSMTHCAKERRRGCGKILNGLVNGIFTWTGALQTTKR
jgi:hypothetical protein